MQHAIECFHTYIDNNESHKYHISDYYYIIKCYLKLLVTFCHTLLHKLTYTDTLNESECPTLGGRAKVVEVAPPPAP